MSETNFEITPASIDESTIALLGRFHQRFPSLETEIIALKVKYPKNKSASEELISSALEMIEQRYETLLVEYLVEQRRDGLLIAFTHTDPLPKENMTIDGFPHWNIDMEKGFSGVLRPYLSEINGTGKPTYHFQKLEDGNFNGRLRWPGIVQESTAKEKSINEVKRKIDAQMRHYFLLTKKYELKEENEAKDTMQNVIAKAISQCPFSPMGLLCRCFDNSALSDVYDERVMKEKALASIKQEVPANVGEQQFCYVEVTPRRTYVVCCSSPLGQHKSIGG